MFVYGGFLVIIFIHNSLAIMTLPVNSNTFLGPTKGNRNVYGF